MKSPSLLARCVSCAALLGALPHGLRAQEAQPHHVVVVVFDGMRPDFVTERTTPNLWRLAQEGVFFAHHHPVYLSATEVNGTAIATGGYPSHSTVVANVDFRPSIDSQLPISIEAPANVRRGDDVSSGRYIALPTVAELLQAHGLKTAIAGSKQVALLHDRRPRANIPGVSPVLFEGTALPSELQTEVVGSLGAFPPVAPDQDKIARDAWTTQAILGTFWKGNLPSYTLLWLSEPDFSQHATGPGSEQSLAAIKGSDEDLGRILSALDRRGLRATTDVFVVSDHGFSSVGEKVDVAAQLSLAGFQTGRAALGGLKPGSVLAVSNGGSTLLYVGRHDPSVCRRLAAYLQRQDWSGVVFSREPEEGTFPLSEAHIDSPEAPDLVLSLHWTGDHSANGTQGMLTVDMSPTGKKAGMHASLSAFDMHNTLVASGPDFKRGVDDTLPTGNTDVAPTILWILGLKDEAGRMDGRVLTEALSGAGPALQHSEVKRLEASRSAPEGLWRQYLQVSEVNGVRYLDEGNGSFTAASK
jgi:predicted AlkP superfamily pyrophosphatase or phosphodiesterase